MFFLKGVLVISIFFSLCGVNHCSLSNANCPKSLYNEPEGTILSPGFNTSQSYGDGSSCWYNILLSLGQRIILEFESLSILGVMPNCTEDSLEIFVGCSAETNVSIGKFCSCSNLVMPEIYSQDHCMTLVFKSDKSKKGEGFVARYKSADNNAAELDSSTNCSKKLLGSHSGTIFTPNWPLQYPTDASCNWTIDLPPSTIAQFFFTSFQVEYTVECDPDRAFFAYDDIRINGINTTGTAVTIKKRICFMPEVAFLTIKAMQSLQVYFRSNQDNADDGPGVIAGYATFKKGTLDSNEAGCKAIETPTLSTGTPTPSTAGTPTPSTAGNTTTSTGVGIPRITMGLLAGVIVIAVVNVVHFL